MSVYRSRNTPYMGGGIGYAGPGTTKSLGLSADPEIMKAAFDQLRREQVQLAAQFSGQPLTGMRTPRAIRPVTMRTGRGRVLDC